jgi:hypothetical protein
MPPAHAPAVGPCMHGPGGRTCASPQQNDSVVARSGEGGYRARDRAEAACSVGNKIEEGSYSGREACSRKGAKSGGRFSAKARTPSCASGERANSCRPLKASAPCPARCSVS